MKKKVREAVFEIELEITKTDNDNIKKRQFPSFVSKLYIKEIFHLSIKA